MANVESSADLKNALRSDIARMESEAATLRTRIEAAKRDLKQLEEYVALEERIRASLRESMTNPHAFSYQTVGRNPPQETISSARQKNPPREDVVSASLELIKAAQKPLDRQELFEQLQERGMRIYGKDPQMVLSTMLWRSQERIVRLRGFGYWPKDEPFAEAMYIPDLDDMLGVASSEPDGEIEEDEGDGSDD